MTRVKFRCLSCVSQPGRATRRYVFGPISPTGEASLFIDDPAVEFTVGRDYYLDFTPVDTG